MTLTRTALTLAATLAVTGGLITAAQATPPNGATAVSDVAVGALDGSERPARWTQDGIQLKTSQPTTVRTFTLTYPPGVDSGWHAHPGIVIAVVKSGTVVRQTPCSTDTFTVGDSFIEVGTHKVNNPGTEDAVLSITRIYPSSQEETPRLNRPEPSCS